MQSGLEITVHPAVQSTSPCVPSDFKRDASRSVVCKFLQGPGVGGIGEEVWGLVFNGDRVSV